MVVFRWKCALCFLFVIDLGHSANILIFPGLGEKTHCLIPRMIGERLVDKGHNVTMLLSSIFVNSSWHSTASDRVPVISHQSIFERDFIIGTIEEFISKSVKGEMSADVYFKQLDRSIEFFSGELGSVLGDYEIMTRLSREKFDLAIIDPFALFPLLVVERLGIPFIPESPGVMPTALARLFALPGNPSYVPEGMTALSHRMTFIERVRNLMNSASYIPFKRIFLNGFDFMRVAWDVNSELTTAQALTKMDMWVVNSGFAMDYPRPFIPQSIMMGGSLARMSSPLEPGEIKEFLDGSDENGVVLVSLGSFVTALDDTKLRILAGAFSQLPHRVLWRLMPEMAPDNLGNNTKIVDWIPQNDILGHPKIAVLVSNAGGLGAYEATFHGVPVVAVPFFTDHVDNAVRLVTKGLAITLEIQTMTTEKVANAILDITNNPSYKRQAERWSGILQDYPDWGLDYGVFWIEFALKHGGDVIRTKGQLLNGIQFYLIDVILFLFLLFHLVEWFLIMFFIRAKKALVR